MRRSVRVFGYGNCPFHTDGGCTITVDQIREIPKNRDVDERIEVADLSGLLIDHGPACLALREGGKVGGLDMTNIPYVRSLDLGDWSGG
jgi:hypothetical protein